MWLVKVIVSVLAACVVSACAASLVEPANGVVSPRPLSLQPDAQKTNEATSSPATSGGQDAFRRAALNLTAISNPESKSYKIGPRDVLEVTVFQAPELSLKDVQVSEAGTISFPLVGEVLAAGRTAREIEQDLRKALRTKYLQNPQVFVKDFFSQRVTIEGAVKKPGVYPIPGGLTILQAIAQAQGFEDNASHTVALFRQAGGKRRLTGQYDVSSIRDGSAQDVQLEAGDVIVVPTSELKEGWNVIMKALPLVTFVPYL